MGIFNRSIPTYTVDTANKLRITTPAEEPEQQSTYIDDAFDPIFNKAVRDRLMKEWGNPISATLAGYYEMLDNSIVGSTEQWGALGSGMGILGSFGRTMDKGGDFILGTLTEGVKGITGQGMESPFHNIFVKDEDYTGGRLLAAMGNSMAKMAGAPKLTEDDFGGLWAVPSMGIELATDPGILGGALSKAGGAVGKMSTAEVLSKLGKSGHSPLADVGQLLSNYDDAMSKIALDVTAPGTRLAITKAKAKLFQMFEHSSGRNLVDAEMDINTTPEEKIAAYETYTHDPNAQMAVRMISNMDNAISEAKTAKELNVLAPPTVQELTDELQKAASPNYVPPDTFLMRYGNLMRRLKPNDFADLYALHRGTSGVISPSNKVMLMYQAFQKHDLDGTLSKSPEFNKLLNSFFELPTVDKNGNPIGHTDGWYKPKNNAVKISDTPAPESLVPVFESLESLKPNVDVIDDTKFEVYPADIMRVLANTDDDEVRTRILQRYKMSPQEYADTVRKEAKFREKTTELKKNFDKAVEEQNSAIKDAFHDTLDTFELPYNYELKYETPITNNTGGLLSDSEFEDLLYDLYGAQVDNPEELFNTVTDYLDSEVSYEEITRSILRNYEVELKELYEKLQTLDPNNAPKSFAEFIYKGVYLKYIPRDMYLSAVQPFIDDAVEHALNNANVETGLESVFYDLKYPLSLRTDFKYDGDAPFTISPSIHRMSNNKDIAENGVKYVERTFYKLMQDLGKFGLDSSEDFWELINKNPSLRAATMPAYKYKEVVDNLKRTFKATTGRDLNIKFNDPSVKYQLLDTIFNNPELRERLGLSEKGYVEGLYDALFGSYDEFNKSYTYQNQLVALDKFTKNIERTLKGKVSNDALVKDVYAKFKEQFGTGIDMPEAEFIYFPEHWYREDIHNALKTSYASLLDKFTAKETSGVAGLIAAMSSIPDDYDEALEWLRNVGASTIKSSETEALYAWAKQMQDEVFLPVRREARGLETYGYKNEGVHKHTSAASGELGGDLSDYDSYAVDIIDDSTDVDDFNSDTILDDMSDNVDDSATIEDMFKSNSTAMETGHSIRKHTEDNIEEGDVGAIYDTRIINELIRKNGDRFKSIADIKRFTKKLNPYFEFKLKPSFVHNISLNGSDIPMYLESYLEKYLDSINRTGQIPYIKLIDDESRAHYQISQAISANNLRLPSNPKIKLVNTYALKDLATTFNIPVDNISDTLDTLRGVYLSEMERLRPYINSELANPEMIEYMKHCEDIVKFPDKATFDLTHLINNIDLNPKRVQPTPLESKQLVGNVLFPKAKSDTSASKFTDTVKTPPNADTPKSKPVEPPKTPSSEVIENEVVEKMAEVPPETAADMAVSPPKLEDEALRTAASASGVEDVLDTALTLAEEFEASIKDLPPEAIERLDFLYGKKKVRLFEVLNDAVVRTTNAKYDPNSALQNRLGHVIGHEAKIIHDTDPKASKRIKMYDAIQTAERGDIMPASKLVDELVSSNEGYVGICLAPSEIEHANTLINSLNNCVTKINEASGFDALSLMVDKTDHLTTIRVAWNVEERKNLLKRKLVIPKFTDADNIVFEAPRELTDVEKAFKASEQYKMYDKFLRRQSSYAQDLYKKFGFAYDASEVHIKHVKADLKDVVNPMTKAMNKGLSDGELFEISRRLRNSEQFKHLYGTFGITPHGRSYRGSVNRWNTDKITTFDFDPVRIVNSTFAEGTLTKSEAQSFIGLFVNDNFKLKTYFKNADELQKVLYKSFEDGSESGNFANLMLVAPVYDASGKVVKFRKFDKTTRAGIEEALNATDAILVPSSLIAPLDIWCKKDAKMSSKIYRFFNSYFALPYKFGVLANPGFVLGNIGDAGLKQITTMSEKYGTSIPTEFANYMSSLREVHYLNNNAAQAYDKIIGFLDQAKVSVPPYERPMTALNLNANARKRVVDFLNGTVVVNGKPVAIGQILTENESDSLRVWLYINNFQNTKYVGEGVRDIAKEGVGEDSDLNLVKKFLYGSKDFSFTENYEDIGLRKPKLRDKLNPKNWTRPKYWGATLNNPINSGVFEISGEWEALTRSANVLNALKHEGLDRQTMSKILGSGFDPAESERLHIETLNAINTMFNANFNYDAQSEFMHTLSYVVPFPTFFLKNFAYWMELLVNNPEYIDTAITIQDNLWRSRDEEVEKDRFMAEAKGRGAIPISDGDNKGLSKLFKGIYKPTPLNSMFGAFNLLNNPVEDLTNRVHPLISAPLQMLQAEMGQRGIGLATQEDANDVKYRPYSMNKFEKNIPYTSPDFDWREYLFHKLNPHDRAMSNAMRLPHKLGTGDVQLADILPSVFQPDF